MKETLASELCRFARQFGPVITQFIERRIRNHTLKKRVLYAVSLTGVRERAFLVKTAARLSKVRWHDAKPAAIAAEFFISSALTADDALDGAEKRWRKTTVASRWGCNEAWLIAEVLHALGHASLDSLRPDAADPMRAAYRRLLEGQFRDIQSPPIRSIKAAIELATEKTGLLIQSCLIVPALIARSPHYASLGAFGIRFGTAFQLVDDIYDFVGDPKIMGKPILGDILNAQPNIVLAHALTRRDSTARREVKRWLARGVQARPKRPVRLLAALHQLDSVEYALHVVKSQIDQGRQALESLPPGKSRRDLERFLELIVQGLLNHG